MNDFAHRGVITKENTVEGVLDILNTTDLGVEIDVRFNTARNVVLCHDREHRNDDENDTLQELLEHLSGISGRYRGRRLMLDIKAFGINQAKELAQKVCKILTKFPIVCETIQLFLCSFNEYCVSELLFVKQDTLILEKILVGVITTGIPLGLYQHLEEVDFVSVDYGILCEEIMDEFRKRDLPVFAWVVNDSSMQTLMRTYGVHGMIYDCYDKEK